GLSGGPVPHAVTSVLGWAAYLAPLVLVPLGALMVMRSALVVLSPFRLGLAVSVVGLMLALGSSHGGWIGDHAESLVALGIGTTGAEIRGVLMTLVGFLFLPGASLGALVRRSGQAVKSASTRVRRERPPAPEPLSESSLDPPSFHPLPKHEQPV